MFTNRSMFTRRVFTPESCGGLEVAAHGVDVAAEDRALADEAVDEHEGGQQDQHHRAVRA